MTTRLDPVQPMRRHVVYSEMESRASSPAPNGSLALVARTPAHVVGVFENVVIHRLIRAAGLDYLDHAAEGRGRALAARRDGYAVLVLVEPTAPLPNEELRREAARRWRESSVDLRAHAIVLGGDGFWAAAAHSAVAALMSVGDDRVPRTVVGHDGEGISFLARHLRRDVSLASGLAQATRDIRGLAA